MSKAIVSDLQAEGWTPDQFGAPADWSQNGGYLQKVLDTASTWAKTKVGATLYDAQASGDAFTLLAQAEVHYGNAVLFGRRIKILDASAVAGLQAGLKIDPLKSMRQQADAALETAQGYLADAMVLLGIDTAASTPGSGMSSSTLETGRYGSASASGVVYG